MSSHRSFCFTLNNPDDRDKSACGPIADLSTVKDFIAAIERGESGTEHIQGAITFSDPKRFDAVVRFFQGKFHHAPHLEVARNVDKAFEYCRKDGNIIVDKQSPRRQGQRTDLQALREALDKGGLCEAKRVCPTELIKYPYGCKLYMSILSPIDRSNFRVLCFIGPAGTGKSTAAMSYNPYLWSNAGQWFDGYAGEQTILLDDFSGDSNEKSITYHFFCRLADRYPLQLPIKGGFVHACHTTLIITSNTEPESWYIRGDVGAVQRRTRHDIGTCYYTNYPMADPTKCSQSAEAAPSLQPSPHPTSPRSASPQQQQPPT